MLLVFIHNNSRAVKTSSDKMRNSKALQQLPAACKLVLRKVEIKRKSYKRRERGETVMVRKVRRGRTHRDRKRESSCISDKVCPPPLFFMRKIKFVNACMQALRRLEASGGISPQSRTLWDMRSLPRQVSALISPSMGQPTGREVMKYFSNTRCIKYLQMCLVLSAY